MHLHQSHWVIAEKCFLKAQNLEPRAINNLVNLAFIYQVTDRLRIAVDLLKECLEIDNNHFEANVLFANVANKMEDWQVAEKYFKKSLEIFPKHLESINNLAVLLKNKGEIKEAVQLYQQALYINPYQPLIYWALANLKSYNFSSQEMHTMLTMLSHKLPIKEHSALLFAIAKGKEDEGMFVESLNYLKKGNKIKYDTFKSADTDWQNIYQKIETMFTQEFIQSEKVTVEHEVRPALIAGMSRSGSTLLEQMLSSHSKITGASELEYLPQLVDRKGVFPLDWEKATQTDFAKLAEDYLCLTKKWWNDTQCFTDKLPRNIKHVGVFLMAFPTGKAIITERNAIDVCLSCFKQNFERGHEYSFNLEQLVEYYYFQKKLGDLWLSLFPNRVIKINYEEMVQDSEKLIRTTLDFLGFEFEQSCLRFYENKRHIRTASAGQVTQNIYRSAVDHYKKYGKSLDHLKELLCSKEKIWNHGE